MTEEEELEADEEGLYEYSFYPVLNPEQHKQVIENMIREFEDILEFGECI